MEYLRKQEESCQQRIIKSKEELAAAKVELENLPPYEPPKDELGCNISSQLLIFSCSVAYYMWVYLPLSLCGTDFCG